jgi:thiamine pyrophosphate-dependent acetolactate synthase large subunit-like protein
MTADQTACTRTVVETTPEAGVVANLGSAAWTLRAVAPDRDRSLCLTGAMGLTTAVGLGAALQSDERVTVLEGDGSLLMSLGTLATVAEADPPNLVVVVWANDAYETTGGQAAAGADVDLLGIAEDCGLPAWGAETDAGFVDAYAAAVTHEGAAVVVCDVAPSRPDPTPTLDYGHSYAKHRFREAFVG